MSLWAALGTALLGGLILNLMPCVFPVLSLKLIGLAQHRTHSGPMAAHGIAFAVGVVLSFVLLAALLIGLQQAGSALGWGFQLQTPWVVAALTVLFFAIGLNLLGVFELTMGTGVANMRAADNLAQASRIGAAASAPACWRLSSLRRAPLRSWARHWVMRSRSRR